MVGFCYLQSSIATIHSCLGHPLATQKLVGSDKSLSKETEIQQSNAASINCHLCGAKFKVWYELINRFVAHIRAVKGQDQKRESKVTDSQQRFLAALKKP